MNEENGNIQHSTLLEEYLLGMSSPEDSARVEQLLASNPELRAEFEQMQADVERFCESYAKETPRDLRSMVLQEFEPAQEQSSPQTDTPSSDGSASNPSSSNKTVMLPVIEKRPIAWPAAAAALAALISLAGAVYFYNQNHLMREQLITSLKQQEDVSRELATIRQQLDQQATSQTVAYHPKTETVLLRGSEKSPGLGVVAYWNAETQQSYINVLWLPEIPDKCYQLWADVHGEMVSLGVLDPTQAPFAPIEFKVDAESLNITLEPKGGSDHPTVTDLVSSIPI